MPIPFGFVGTSGAGQIIVTSLGTAAGTSDGSGNLVLTTTATAPLGSTIVLIACDAGVSVGLESATDGVNNTYTSGFLHADLNGLSTNGSVRAIYAFNVHKLDSGLTITYEGTGTGSKVAVSAFCITGLTTTDPIDSAVTATAGGTGASPTVTSGTPTQAGDVIIGFIGILGNSNAGTFTQATNVAWATPPNESTTGSVITDRRVNGGFFVNSGTGTETYNPTYSVATNTLWAAGIIGFKQA